MAEFINSEKQQTQRASDAVTEDGMNAFGKVVPYYRRIAAEEHAKEMGLQDASRITGMIQRASEAIHRDKPYEALEAITAYLDLTGAYRLLAVLCTAPAPEGVNEPEAQAVPVKKGPDTEYSGRQMTVYEDYA